MASEFEPNNWSSSQSTLTPTRPPSPASSDTNAIPPQTSFSNSLNTPPLPTSVFSSSIPSPSPSNGQSLTNSYTTFTTSYPVVVSQSSTTFTSYVTTIITSSIPMAVTQTPTAQSNLGVNSVCIGHGIDSISIGLLAVAILSAFFGFIVWVRAVADPKRVHPERD